MSRHSLFFALALVLGCPTAKSDDTAVVPDDTSGADDTAPPTDSDDSGPRDSGPTDADDDGYPAAMDCDDTDAAVHPDAAERCNGRDDDCDGVADEDGVDGGPWYADADGDGYGDPAAGTQTECEAPAGYGADGSDCDDADASRYPGAPEICDDGIANDCAETTTEAAGQCIRSGDVSVTGADAALAGEYNYGGAGRNVDGSGDLDGDGVNDVLIAADSTVADRHGGGAYVVYGPVTADASLSTVATRLT